MEVRSFHSSHARALATPCNSAVEVQIAFVFVSRVGWRRENAATAEDVGEAQPHAHEETSAIAYVFFMVEIRKSARANESATYEGA